MNITAEDIKKLAKLSQINVAQQEQESLRTNLQNVLQYAARVQQIARDSAHQQVQARCPLREDVAVPFDSRAIMTQAPEKTENLFVVPKII